MNADFSRGSGWSSSQNGKQATAILKQLGVLGNMTGQGASYTGGHVFLVCSLHQDLSGKAQDPLLRQ